MAGLGTEIVWQIEAGHQDEGGGEPSRKPFAQAGLQDSLPSSPEAPCSPWNPELGLPADANVPSSHVREVRLSPGRVHEIVTAAMLSGIPDLPTPRPRFCLWTEPLRPRYLF